MAAAASPGPQWTCDDLLQLKPSLQTYLDRFLPLFPCRDQGAVLRRPRRGAAVQGAFPWTPVTRESDIHGVNDGI